MSIVTVIGGRGFIGGRVLRQLRRAGADVIAPDPRSDGCEQALLTRPLGHVVYAAGLTADFAQRPFETVEAHVTLLSRLLRDADFERLVYLSSTRLYDGLPPGPVHEDAVLRLSPGAPRHLYDLSKAMGESLCCSAAAGRAVVARLSCVYAGDEDEDAGGFLPDLLRRMRRERDLTIDSASGSVRDYVHVDDVVQSIIVLLRSGEQGVVNVASGENLANADIAALAAGLGWRLRFTRETAVEAAPTIAINRLRGLGVHPRRTADFLRERLRQA